MARSLYALKPQHEKMARALASGMTIKEAYIAAGYNYGNGKSATRMANDSRITQRVAQIQAERAADDVEARQRAVKKAGLTKEWVIERLMYNAERALRGTPVLDANGVQTGKFSGKPEGHVANRALELLGQTMGIFVQRHELGGPGDFADLSDDALVAKIREEGAQLGMPAKVIDAWLASSGIFEVEGTGRKQ